MCAGFGRDAVEWPVKASYGTFDAPASAVGDHVHAPEFDNLGRRGAASRLNVDDPQPHDRSSQHSAADLRASSRAIVITASVILRPPNLLDRGFLNEASGSACRRGTHDRASR